MTSNFRVLTANVFFLLPTPFGTRHLLSGGGRGTFRERERERERWVVRGWGGGAEGGSGFFVRGIGGGGDIFCWAYVRWGVGFRFPSISVHKKTVTASG